MDEDKEYFNIFLQILAKLNDIDQHLLELITNGKIENSSNDTTKKVQRWITNLKEQSIK